MLFLRGALRPEGVGGVACSKVEKVFSDLIIYLFRRIGFYFIGRLGVYATWIIWEEERSERRDYCIARKVSLFSYGQ